MEYYLDNLESFIEHSHIHGLCTMNILVLVFTHWLCDFVLQTSWMANNKSKSLKALLAHTLTYSVGMTVLNMLWESYYQGFSWHSWPFFFMVTFTAHTFTDFVTSKFTTKAYAAGKYRLFFAIIGFDQFLHMAQLFITSNLM